MIPLETADDARAASARIGHARAAIAVLAAMSLISATASSLGRQDVAVVVSLAGFAIIFGVAGRSERIRRAAVDAEVLRSLRESSASLALLTEQIRGNAADLRNLSGARVVSPCAVTVLAHGESVTRRDGSCACDSQDARASTP